MGLIIINIFITNSYAHNTAQKLSFPLRIYSVNVTKSAVPFTEEILNKKLHFFAA